MSVASLGTTTSTAFNQAQSLLQGHHGNKVKQAGGTDLLAQITAQLTGGSAASESTPGGGFSSSLGRLGTDVLSALGLGGGTSTPAAAASAYAASQNSI